MHRRRNIPLASAARGKVVLLASALASIPLLPSPGALAQDVTDASEPAVPEKAGKILRAMRLGDETIAIDGWLDETAWSLADSISDLVQMEPNNMAPITEYTVVRVLYDDTHMFVGMYAYDRDPDQIARGLVRRDETARTDRVSVAFDPRHDHLTGYAFSTNPSGLERDLSFFDDVNLNPDYDAVWDVGTRVTEDGWVAEFRIPFSQMRFTRPASGR